MTNILSLKWEDLVFTTEPWREYLTIRVASTKSDQMRGAGKKEVHTPDKAVIRAIRAHWKSFHIRGPMSRCSWKVFPTLGNTEAVDVMLHKVSKAAGFVTPFSSHSFRRGRAVREYMRYRIKLYPVKRFGHERALEGGRQDMDWSPGSTAVNTYIDRSAQSHADRLQHMWDNDPANPPEIEDAHWRFREFVGGEHGFRSQRQHEVQLRQRERAQGRFDPTWIEVRDWLQRHGEELKLPPTAFKLAKMRASCITPSNSSSSAVCEGGAARSDDGSWTRSTMTKWR